MFAPGRKGNTYLWFRDISALKYTREKINAYLYSRRAAPVAVTQFQGLRVACAAESIKNGMHPTKFGGDSKIK